MKKLICAIALSAILAACGNSPGNKNGTDSTMVGPDSTMRTDSTMRADTALHDSLR